MALAVRAGRSRCEAGGRSQAVQNSITSSLTGSSLRIDAILLNLPEGSRRDIGARRENVGRQMKRIRFAALLVLAACGGGGGDEGPPPGPPQQWKRNCLYEWNFPGVPNTTPITYRCYYITGECKTTDVCNGIPPAACPYTQNECVVCPTDKPLSQC
jgi:hypothetical protein